ncbi:hypothetical protein O181_050935 [Austropuccinia psidii MF-1]|uniref:Uncharacterized protein n=1 Tax=Austropuccinia psidii MF-1 TaxID=1389203 RepID=A0A9Q3E217_9BASI|nr:hypothetical protein [Austropuccinia psidii MF-1]
MFGWLVAAPIGVGWECRARQSSRAGGDWMRSATPIRSGFELRLGFWATCGLGLGRWPVKQRRTKLRTIQSMEAIQAKLNQN